MRRGSFAQAAIGQGAAALNRVFERYLIPVTFSSEQLHLHMTYNDVDASASPIWYDEGGSVMAAALLAMRGKRGWIGGFGVAPEYRGQGIAAQLLDGMLETARERGLESIQLEVLEDNLPAFSIYRKAGFEVIRTLVSFKRSIEQAVKARGFVNAAPDDFIDRPDPVPPCWQRERRTLVNGAASTACADTSGNYALFRYNAQTAQVLKISTVDAVTLDSLAHAIAAGRELENIVLLNEPGASPIAALAETAGWNRSFSQYEMLLNLRP